MKKEIVFISNQFEKSENWESENGIVKIVFTNALSANEIVSEINEYSNGDFVFVIYAHLTTINKKWADDFGFDIAREIRVKLKSKNPIILYSPDPKENFEKKSKSGIKYKILFGRGTAFLPFDKLKDELVNAIDELKKNPLTDAVLADMNEMLFDQKGVVIDKLTHDLKFNKLGNNGDKLKSVLNEAAAYLTDDQLGSLKWPEFHKQLFQNISDSGKFNITADKLIRECERVLVSETKSAKAVSDKKHKILILEDDPIFRKMIEDNLREHFEEIIITENAEEAIQKINADGINAITGIITDWRLYKNQTEYWQIQGYEVLDFAAKNHLTALFALTSLSDYNVHNIRNALGIDIHLFKKQYLDISDSWKIVADTVKQKCDAVLDIISSLPTGGNWLQLQNEYCKKRNSGWDVYENEITTEATRIFNYYFEAIIQGNEKNVFSISDMGIALKDNLKSILITRRIFFGIYFSLIKTNRNLQDIKPARLLGDGLNFDTELKQHSVDTYSLLRKDWWDDVSDSIDSTLVESEWRKFDQRIKNLKGTLCIELTELPKKGILPEERNWLSKNNIDHSFHFRYSTEDEE